MSKARQPRAVIHKRILDVARAHPNASIQKITEEVSGATFDLVERVLTEYGDPTDDYQEPMTDHQDDLTDRQREILLTIERNPDATQRELASRLDITAPTVSRHLNKIDGWDWERRLEFAETVSGNGDEPPDSETEQSATESTGSPDDDSPESASAVGEESTSAAPEESAPTAPEESASAVDERSESTVGEEPPETACAVTSPTEDQSDAVRASTDGSGVSRSTLDGIDQRITHLEQRIGESDALIEDPELVHKIVHVCMDSERISEEEELRIIETFLG